MTATLAASQAILRRRYIEGTPPKANYSQFPFMAMVTKKEDWDGDDLAVALQTENPQGSASNVPDALSSLRQGTYRRFLMSRREHFGIARVKGQAIRATKGKSGALVDLWTNECDGITQTELKNYEIYAFGDGTGIIGQIASGSTTATITLGTPEDIANFDLGMKVAVVSAATLSPTVITASGGTQPGVVTGLVRNMDGSCTVTLDAAWNVHFPGIGSTYYIVRHGDQAVSGTQAVWTGLLQWFEGGASPSTIGGLTRTSDPVRLASQTFSAANRNMEDALIDLESLITSQGHTDEKVAWCNPRDVRKLKKQTSGKVTYPRTEVKIAGIGFKAIEFEGDSGTIKLMQSPFVRSGHVIMCAMPFISFNSLGPAPHLLREDGQDILRVATDDAYETRFGTYGDLIAGRAPVKSARMTGWGT